MKLPKAAIPLLIVIPVLLVAAFLVLHDQVGIRRSIESYTAHMSRNTSQPFPDIDETNLNELQKNIIRVSKIEYSKKPISYDENVLTYSSGVREAWCADYVSWVMRESGAPLKNPNSGGWRIPGVLTLREYYKQNNRFKDAQDYAPQPGDVAIYVNTTSFNTSRQHTSIVLKVEKDRMTTIGGNEMGRLRVSTQSMKKGDKGLVGYGVLPKPTP